MAGSWDVDPVSKGGAWDSRAAAGSPGFNAADAPQGGPAGSSVLVSRAPIVWLVAGLAAAVLGLVLPLRAGGPTFAVLGWSLSGPVAIGLLGVFLWRDLERRSHGLAADSQAADWMRRLLLVIAVAAVAYNAWIIADAVARGDW